MPCALGLCAKNRGRFFRPRGIWFRQWSQACRRIRGYPLGKLFQPEYAASHSWGCNGMALRPHDGKSGPNLQWRSAFKPDEYPCTTKIPEITDPFTGKTFGALPIAKPELAAIHVPMADVEGNANIPGYGMGPFRTGSSSAKSNPAGRSDR